MPPFELLCHYFIPIDAKYDQGKAHYREKPKQRSCPEKVTRENFMQLANKI